MRMVNVNGRGSEKGRPNRKARPEKDKIHHYPHSVKTKILIIQEAYEAERRIKPVARKHRVAPDSIKQWKHNLVNLKAKALINPNAKTAHLGATVKDAHVESQLRTWILQQRKQDLLVRTRDIIYQAIRISPNFKGRSKKTLNRWVYDYLGRNGLSIRHVTQVGQKLSGHLEQVRNDTAIAISSRFLPGGTLAGIERKYFINMDQTAVFYECKSSTTVSEIGFNSVPGRDSGSSSKRCTVVLAVAADGTKLPPFVVFKGMCMIEFCYCYRLKKSDNFLFFPGSPGARVEKEITDKGWKACVQAKGWFDGRVAKIWIDMILKPHLEGSRGSFPLVDQLKVHMAGEFV